MSSTPMMIGIMAVITAIAIHNSVAINNLNKKINSSPDSPIGYMQKIGSRSGSAEGGFTTIPVGSFLKNGYSQVIVEAYLAPIVGGAVITLGTVAGATKAPLKELATFSFSANGALGGDLIRTEAVTVAGCSTYLRCIVHQAPPAGFGTRQYIQQEAIYTYPGVGTTTNRGGGWHDSATGALDSLQIICPQDPKMKYTYVMWGVPNMFM